VSSAGVPRDAWSDADRYESYIGRWSREVARTFVRWVAVPDAARWIDVGCGTGALSGAIVELRSPGAVLGVDPSPAFLERAAASVRGRSVEFLQADAARLPAGDRAFDAVVSGLVLNFLPDTGAALAEMVRVARPGGVVAAYVWDYAEGMELLRHFWDAAVALDPQAAAHDEGRRFPLCRPPALTGAFRAAGLADVAVEPVDVPAAFAGFDDYWTPFLGGTGPAPAYVASLDVDRVAALRAAVRDRLPVAPDGAIRLSARAWAVSGEVRHAGS
jgi:SAM-dependent methyltransferase